jgi:DNA-binding beta-propeller fold protein YncE
MKRFFPGTDWKIALAVGGMVLGTFVRADSGYHLLKQISVPGDAHWDYLSVDSTAHRLYVAHGINILVVDTQTDAVVGEIADTPGVHGFAIAPELDRGFSSNGKESKAALVDLKTLKTVSRVETGAGPDAILYASTQHEVYVFNGRSHSATVFDAVTGRVVATIALPGKPEFAAYDPISNVVFDNIEDKNEVIAIDAKARLIVNTWPIAPGVAGSGLSIDAEHHRLFIGCGNQLLVMMDSMTGQVLATVPIGKGVDATVFDAGAQLAFASTGEGTLTMARETAPDQLQVVQNITTAKGARTMAVDLLSHKIYTATASFYSPKVGLSLASRPVPIPGSFKILVYAPAP